MPYADSDVVPRNAAAARLASLVIDETYRTEENCDSDPITWADYLTDAITYLERQLELSQGSE